MLRNQTDMQLKGIQVEKKIAWFSLKKTLTDLKTNFTKFKLLLPSVSKI